MRDAVGRMRIPSIADNLCSRTVAPGRTAALRFFAERALPRVEEPLTLGLRRALAVGESQGVVEMHVAEDGVHVTSENLPERWASGVVARAFDDDGDRDAVADVLTRDPLMAPLVRACPDVRVPGAFDGHETAIRAVLGQQVSVAAANTLAGRIVEQLGRRIDPSVGSVTHVFPSPAAIAEGDLTGLGMPTGRIAAVRALAAALADGAIDLERRPGDVRDALLALPGVGPWTASYICMRVLRDRDAFIASDLGVKKGAAALGLPRSPGSLERHAERWRPFRAYAVMYLWLAAHTPP
jgi:AraC family transcriptional regulator, regulatory protein of adaptative response / DNA-3-methyladenine glycosylase II